MCLGIPAQVLGPSDEHPDLMIAEVQGARRQVNIALLNRPPESGDWVLLHMGFAMEPMTPAQAEEALAVLGGDPDDLDRILQSRPDTAAGDDPPW